MSRGGLRVSSSSTDRTCATSPTGCSGRWARPTTQSGTRGCGPRRSLRRY